MKRLAAILLLIFVAYIVYYDLRIGTLPVFPNGSFIKAVNAKEQTENEYVEVKVKKGDTVLSIVKSLHNHTIPVPVEKIVADFQLLNKKEDVYEMKAGKTYKFPLYP